MKFDKYFGYAAAIVISVILFIMGIVYAHKYAWVAYCMIVLGFISFVVIVLPLMLVITNEIAGMLRDRFENDHQG